VNMKKWVISLGGSRIVPDDVDDKFLKDFKKLILAHKDHRFVVVTGGGTTARKYIKALEEMEEGSKKKSATGIAITRFHASFLMRVFGEPANEELPFSIKKVESLLAKNQVVFCGALRQNFRQTTDGTAAQIASKMGCPFINLTNVRGLYNADPKKNKSAKLISNISWKDFNKIVSKIKFKDGQHFVLDQVAARLIMRRKIKTYIVGTLNDIKKIINDQKFNGTLIEG